MDANFDLVNNELLMLVRPEDRDFFKEYFLDTDSEEEFLGFPNEEREKSQGNGVVQRDGGGPDVASDSAVSVTETESPIETSTSEDESVTSTSESSSISLDSDADLLNHHDFQLEEVDIGIVGRIENPPGDVNQAADVENGWSASRQDDLPQFLRPFDAEPKLNAPVTDDSTPLEFFFHR